MVTVVVMWSLGKPAIAKGCPHLERGGGLEVGQLGEVPGPTV